MDWRGERTSCYRLLPITEGVIAITIVVPNAAVLVVDATRPFHQLLVRGSKPVDDRDGYSSSDLFFIDMIGQIESRRVEAH